MKKIMKILSILVLLAYIYLPSMAQSYQPMTSYGYHAKRFDIDSTFFVPNRDTTISGSFERPGALVFRTIGGDHTLYAYTGAKWINVSAGLSKALISMFVNGDTLYAVLENNDTVKTDLPLYNPTSSDATILFTGDGKVYGAPLDFKIDLSKIPVGLTKDSAVYDIKGDTGITVTGGDNTQFLDSIKIKAKFESPIWNAAFLHGEPLGNTGSQDGDILLYSGGAWVNQDPSSIITQPDIEEGTDIGITGGHTINNTSTLQTVTNRGASTSNNMISTAGLTVKKNTGSFYFLQNGAGKQRWTFGLSGSESGSNAGADLSITGYDDNGTGLGSYLKIKRNNGWIGINAEPTSQLDVGGKVTADGLHLNLTGSSVGDIYYVDNNGDFQRLGIGSPGQVLTVTSGLPRWQTNTADYELPIASGSTLGGIKVGENLTIGVDGTLNAQASGGSQDLQSVTHIGNHTDSSIIIKNGSDSIVLHSNGDVFITGHITAVGGGGEASDIRLKNIQDVEPIHVIKELHPVMFKWKNQNTDTLMHIGYIAQQVKDFMPQAVRKMPNGYYSVDYTQIHTAAINDLYNLVKEQQKEIEALKKEIEQLKSEYR